MRIFQTLIGALTIMGLFGCATTGDGLAEECSLPTGVTVASITLDEDQAGDLPASGETGFRVTVELSQAIPEGTLGIICYAVRDSEIIRGMPLAVGFVGMTSADGTRATRENSFNMTCDDGEVAGRAATSAMGMDDFDRSSGERSTRIFAQHLEGLRTFAGNVIGMTGETSNRIRLTCPRS